MAGKSKKLGQEVKLAGFTRGGMPVGMRTGAKSSVKPAGGRTGKSYGVGEYVAIGAAAGLTGLVGAVTVSALNEGFRGGTGKLGPKGK